MIWVKRIGWGAAAIGLLLLVLFASMVRITVNGPANRSARVQEQLAPATASRPVNYTLKAQPGDRAPLIVPVAGVSVRQLTDTWGQSRGGGAREHHAIDILAPQGTPVLAAASGIVEKLFESANGGHTIYVRTSDGATVHYYAHLDSYAVSEQQRVRQGDVIAAVGNTGSAAGSAPHLHFEIKAMQPGERWWQGANVNPYPLLAAIAPRG